MKKTLTFLLALLLLGVQQGVASEKQEKEKTPKQKTEQPAKKTKLQRQAEKGDGMAKAVLEALMPGISMSAIQEYLQTENLPHEVRDNGTFILLNCEGKDIGLELQGNILLVRTPVYNIKNLDALKDRPFTAKEELAIYKACNLISQHLSCIKAIYSNADDAILISVESIMHNMPAVRTYLVTIVNQVLEVSKMMNDAIAYHLKNSND